MDRYQKVEKPKPESPINQNEIRITTQGAIRNYITYATSLLQEKNATEIVLKAMGQAISKTVAIAEIFKKRIPQLHQDTAISSVSITDVWEPIEEGLVPVEMTRHVSMISITLSTGELNKDAPGYQAPNNVEQAKPNFNYQRQPIKPARGPYNSVNEDSYGQGRGRGRGRGRNWGRGGYGYQGGYGNYQGGYEYSQGGYANYQDNGGYSNRGRGGGRGRGWGYHGYEGGRGGGTGYEGGRGGGGTGYERGRGRDTGYEGGRGGGGAGYERGRGGGTGYGGRGGGGAGYERRGGDGGADYERGRGGGIGYDGGRGTGYDGGRAGGGNGYERGGRGGGRGYGRGRGRMGGRTTRGGGNQA
ncbi:PREDICTED: glycine-rich cell wall structural protein 1.0-like isoform X4 [Lupinus angustifolius]|uniref:glycine-rich cell wall structural protein 1.0-like isoform X4 n=1 Tax=Lupinus angustifolius TaxID=3871 RepID=UPI00092E4A11|nr:PREDICTED: glycine-rich cell wall structural protein 1.0-like isoform X4 [Lupinus angustifolius]